MRPAILFAILFSLAVPVLAAGKADALLDLADVQMRHRDFATALSYYDKAIAAEPTCVLAHLGRLEAIRRGGKDPLPEAEDAYLKKPGDAAIATAYASLLPPERALEVIDKLTAPDFYAGLVKVRALSALGRGETSAETATVEGKCPPDARALSLLAGFYEDLDRLEKAAEMYAKAVEIAPTRVESLVGLGNALRLAGKYDDAKAALEKAQKVDKEDAEIPYRLGLTLLDKGDFESAVTVLELACTMSKDNVDFLLALGDAELKFAKPEAAESTFAKAVEIAPRRVDARRRYGYALDLVDKNDDALDQYRELLKLDPLNSACRVAIGWILAKKGKYDEALKEFRQAADANANDPVALFFVGYTFDLMGKWGEAVDAYDKVVKKFPTYARAWNNLGLDQDLLGKGSAAIASLKKAVDLDPDNPEYLANLGNSYYFAKKYKDAEEVFSRLVDQCPTRCSAGRVSAAC